MSDNYDPLYEDGNYHPDHPLNRRTIWKTKGGQEIIIETYTDLEHMKNICKLIKEVPSDNTIQAYRDCIIDYINNDIEDTETAQAMWDRDY